MLFSRPFSAGTPMDTNLEQRIEFIRQFNRFYTRQIGVLNEGLLNSPFSLAEVRVLYETAQCPDVTASELANKLSLDAGYLSRLLLGLRKRGLMMRKRSSSDGRQSHLSLTKKGQKTFAMLNGRSQEEMGAMLKKLSITDQTSLVEAMQRIEGLLGESNGKRTAAKAPYLLRSHQPGDMGWVTHRHGVLYAQEYGYDERFEALVAEIVAKFIQNFDPKRDRCWIAEIDGEIVGSVFLVKGSATVAKLRLLLVETQARGMGIGKRLVSECERFARQAGYKKVMLWTQSELLGARHIYSAAGYRKVGEEPHYSFGKNLVAETWELKL